jgi:quinol monooxygenase YgiN
VFDANPIGEKAMYIAVISYAIQPEKKEEMLALLHDESAAQEALSLLMKIPGVTGYYSLVTPEGDKGLAVYLYASEAQAKAAPSTPEYQAFITSPYSTKTLSCAVQGSVNRQIYEVTGHG